MTRKIDPMLWRDVGYRVCLVRQSLDLTQCALANIAQMPSTDAISRVERFMPVSFKNLVRIACGLGISVSEIDPRRHRSWKEPEILRRDAMMRRHADECEALCERMPMHMEALRRYWLKSEADIERVWGKLDDMLADVLLADRLIDQLDVEHIGLAGLCAAELMGAIWSFYGPEAMKESARVLHAAERCAIRIEEVNPARAAEIQAIRRYNSLGMSAWSEPHRELAPAAARINASNFALSECYFQRAAVLAPTEEKSASSDALLQLLHRAQMLIQGGAAMRNDAFATVEEAKSRARGESELTRAHVARIQGLYAEMHRGKDWKTRAEDCLREAADLYRRGLGTTEHYLHASCRMRLRRLGQECERELDQDISILASSRVKHADVISLVEVRAIYPSDFQYRESRNA